MQFVLGYQHEDFALVLDLMAQRRIDVAALVTRVIGLDDLPEMFERLRRPGPDAKVLIDPSLKGRKARALPWTRQRQRLWTPFV